MPLLVPRNLMELADGGLAPGTCLPCFLLAVGTSSQLHLAQASFF